MDSLGEKGKGGGDIIIVDGRTEEEESGKGAVGREGS